MFKSSKLLKLALIFGLTTTPVMAHQVLTEDLGSNKYEVKFWAHDGYEAYQPEQLIQVKGYDEALNEVRTGIRYNRGTEKAPEVLTEKTAALMVSVYDAGYWVDSNAGFVVGDKIEAEGIVFGAISSIKMGKTYYEWNEKMLAPLGLKYEVIALSDVTKLKKGDYLSVLVLKDGKPASGVAFENNTDSLSEETNEFGIAYLPVNFDGLNILASTFEEPLFNDPKAETLFIQSSISFWVK